MYWAYAGLLEVLTMIMAIQLTEEQRQALLAEGMPVDVVDPATQQRYVLLAREHYERVRALLEQETARETQEPSAGIPPGILRSQQAYWRDLPELMKLKSRKHQWVAYQGDARIGFGRTNVELYQACLRRGLERSEFYVGKLVADPEGIPPWGSTPIEVSLYEFTDAPPPSDAPPTP